MELQRLFKEIQGLQTITDVNVEQACGLSLAPTLHVVRIHTAHAELPLRALT